MSTEIKLSNDQIARLGYDAWNDRDYDRGAALFAEDGEIAVRRLARDVEAHDDNSRAR